MRTRIALILLFIAAPALAVKTSHWLHTTESDFKEGTSKNVVATNLGDLKLSRQVKSLIGENPRVSAVFAMAQASDGTIYAGTGPEGLLLAIKDEKVTTVAELGQHASVLSLVVDPQGRVYIGTGAEKGEILRIDKPGEKPHAIFSADDVQYIWAMTRSADGTLYAATGPNGQLFQINPDGSSKVLCDTDENNLMCLIDDGKDNLYFGTDPNGLVCRVNRKTGEMFVLFDAPEDEINALARDAHGNVYAGTAQSIEEANAGPADANAPADQGGRPEGETRGVPIPSKPPPAPAPPPIPGPAPGEPLPIPKGQTVPMSLLILAGEEGPPGAGPTSAPAVTGGGQHKSSAVPMGDHEHAASNGNAVYRIDPDGFVTEVFRQPASVFAIVEQGGSLLVATGNEGNLYQVNPAAEESLVQAKLDSKQIMCLLPAKDGRVLMGTANSGDVIAMTSGFAPLGTYTSPVLDATQISRFGKIQLHGTLPGGTSLKLATRSGNIEDAASPGWSSWSEDVPAAEFVQSQSPAARFFQYRLTFTSESGAATPVVEEISVAYQVPNLAPQIKAIKTPDSKADDGRGTGKISITWMATDPNEDELLYSIYFRSSSRAPWILLKDKLKDPTFDWDTRSVADGRYEIKVEASDAAANPVGQGKTASRVSDPIVVDNTPPVMGDIRSSVAGADATIKLNVVDRATTVARLEYSVDSSDQWQTVLPSDNIADSPQEAYDFVIKDLPAGAHQIALRASDSEGNRAFESVSVTIERK